LQGFRLFIFRGNGSLGLNDIQLPFKLVTCNTGATKTAQGAAYIFTDLLLVNRCLFTPYKLQVIKFMLSVALFFCIFAPTKKT